MQKIHTILKNKGEQVWTVSADTLVFDALKIMAEKDIGALPVLEGTDLVGIFSERDYARKVILMGKSSRQLRVGEIMSTHLVVITPDRSAEEGLALMTAHRVRHLPVLSDHQLAGFVSVGDLVKSIIDDQKVVIDKLEQYIREKVGFFD